MPIQENAIKVSYRRKKSEKAHLLLDYLLEDPNAPQSIELLKNPDMEIELIDQQVNHARIKEILKKLSEQCGISQREFKQFPLEQAFSDIEFGRGLVEMALQYFFKFLPDSLKKDPKEARRLLWALANQESYGFIVPEENRPAISTERLDLPDKDAFRQAAAENYPRKKRLLHEHIKQLNSYISDYSHSFKLVQIRPPNSNDLIGLYNFSVIEALIRASSTVVLILPKLSGEMFKVIHNNLRFAPVYYTIYAESWKEKKSVVLSFNLEGYFSKRINRSNAFLSAVLLKKIIPNLLDHEIDFLILQMTKYRNDFRVIHLGAGDFANIFWPWNLAPRSDESENDWHQTTPAKPLYDSEIETEFANAFDLYFPVPWILEREPETITTQYGKIFLPDFLITNGLEKIYLEVVGFWTEKYITKKQEKISEFLEMENPPNLIFFIDKQLRTHFTQFVGKHSKLTFLFYKANKVSKAVQELKRICFDQYAPKVLLRDEIDAVIKDNSLWTSVMGKLESNLWLSMKQFVEIAKTHFKETLTPEARGSLKVNRKFFEKELETKEYRQFIESKPYNLKYIKRTGFLSKFNFHQLIDLIPSVFQEDTKLSKMEFSRRFKTQVEIPFDPLILIDYHPNYKLEWQGLMDVFIVQDCS